MKWLNAGIVESNYFLPTTYKSQLSCISIWDPMKNVQRKTNDYDLGKKFLTHNWQLYKTQANQYKSLSDIVFSTQTAVVTTVPSTVAEALDLEPPDCWTPPENYDDSDWWYKTEFDIETPCVDHLIAFEGLASIAEVWLNQKPILTTNNMFLKHQLDVSSILKTNGNELIICFRSLSQELAQKKPRPKWKTKLIEKQSLRWFRTTLLGRIPGWTPPVSAVGPWKPIYLIDTSEPHSFNLNTNVLGTDGVIEFSCEISKGEQLIDAHIEIDSISYQLKISESSNRYYLNDSIRITNVSLWWPHTHGEPVLYSPKLVLTYSGSEKIYELPKVGFKYIKLDQTNNDFKISVNGKSIFCRGACWTINDIVSLTGSEEKLTNTLKLMRNAGANIIRIGGTMIYEQDLFYRLCDQLGLLVWQDFMFANMDYPFEDENFRASTEKEVKQQLERLNKHVSIAVYCGNSEIQQQVSMLGYEESSWKIPFFDNTLREICKNSSPSIPYISSTPSGAQLPFRTDKGLSHYYGVGAYLQPVKNLRSHDVKFTSECLGFSNIPNLKLRNSVLDGNLPVCHNPIWKQRTPRDTGTGWDFEDVRDYYLKELFDVDPISMRSFDPEHYMLLSELVTGEIMSQVFSEWRSTKSHCNGGIVWFLQDFWPGAGWGILDNQGEPKACYYYLKRAWKSIGIAITDETINGLNLTLFNETDNSFQGSIELIIVNETGTNIIEVSDKISIDSNSSSLIESEQMINRFFDITYSYRFGPSKHIAVVARLLSDTDELVDEKFYFPESKIPTKVSPENITYLLEKIDQENILLTIASNSFVYGLYIEAPTYQIDDNYFHMAPGSKRTIHIKGTDPTKNKFKGYISAINLVESIKLK